MMKLNKVFPIQEFVTVPVEGGEIQVKYKFPNMKERLEISRGDSDLAVAVAILKYCVQEIQGFEEPIVAPIADDVILALANNHYAVPIGLYYSKNINPEEKKR